MPMFAETSRYAGVPTIEVQTAEGRVVTAVTLRRLPRRAGSATPVNRNDRLDVLAQRRYGDPTRFWHIADANSEPRADDLLRVVGDEAPIVNLPEE
jgi:hypothetical protein